MAWLLKSEVNGSPLGGEEFIDEVLRLPGGKQKLAVLYEHMVYLQNIDMIVLIVCMIHKRKTPSLFCISDEEVSNFTKIFDRDHAIDGLAHHFKDKETSDGFIKWMKFATPVFPMNSIIDLLINTSTLHNRKYKLPLFSKVYKDVRNIQEALASDLFYSFDEHDKKAYLYLLGLFKPIYHSICDQFITPQELMRKQQIENEKLVQEIHKDFFGEELYNKLRKKHTNEDESFESGKYLAGKKIPEIILELERAEHLIRKERYFIPAISSWALHNELNYNQKMLLRNVFEEWIYNPKTYDKYSKNTIKQVLKNSQW